MGAREGEKIVGVVLIGLKFTKSRVDSKNFSVFQTLIKLFMKKGYS